MKRSTEILILTTALLLIAVGIIGIVYLIMQEPEVTGAAITNNYSYTKALCNETNYCQDYEIKCIGDQLIEISPISGAAIQLNSNWKDPRDKDIIESLCI